MSKIEFDLSSMSRRDVILIIVSASIIIGVIVGLVIFLSGGKKLPDKSAMLTQSAVAPTVTLIALPATPSPNATPTLEPTIGPTATLQPYAHTVASGETLFAIIQLYGYRDYAVIPELLRINGMGSINDPIPVGKTLLIPMQTPTEGPTPTPTIEGATAGPTVDYTGCTAEKHCTTSDGQFYIHEVQPGDTPLSIAVAYNTRIEDLMAANGLPSNGVIYPGQKLKVPILVTLTPTLTPTGGPDSTGTPTPTLSSPSLLVPAFNATIARGDTVILQWATIHVLANNQNYLVIVTDLSSGKDTRAVTRANTYRLPSSLQPGLGQSTRFEWQVLVIAGADPNGKPISGQDVKSAFTWGP